MKKIFLAFLVMATLNVHSAEVAVLDVDLTGINPHRSMVDARFYMDPNSQEGFVKVSVTEERYIYGGGWYGRGRWGGGWGGWYGDDWYGDSMPMPMRVLVFESTIRLEGLMLVDDKAIFYAEAGEVECGTMGRSRVLRRPTLYLSGKCELTGNITGDWRHSKVSVKFLTR